MRTIWGFDLGVTSVGSAVVRWNERADQSGQGEILHLGVRIFPESREADGDKNPKNVARRGARLARRQMRRRRWRRVELRRLLAEAGLLPAHDAVPPAGQDPVTLRQHGLSRALMPNELGWALFHLLKRRGFLGSRKRVEQDKKIADEETEAKSKGQQLAVAMGGRRLGEYLAGIETSVEEPKRRRDVGQTRRMVEDELDALWREQHKYHPELLTQALRDRVDRIALYQRPTFFRRRTIGRCELEPTAERALKAEWLTQQFEMLQLVNALRLDGGNQPPLDPTQRAKAIAYLESAPNPTWAKLRDAIGGLPKGTRFTHERGKKETVRGNATEAALRAALGPEFAMLPIADAIRAAIGQAWHRTEYRPARGGSILEIRDAADIAAEQSKLAARARAEWGLSAAQAARLATIDLPGDHGRHSLAAMRRLLPHLESGMPYMTAVQREYQPRESVAPLRRLPGPNPGELPRIADPFVRQRMAALLAGIRNPTVMRTLGELQKVVNTLLTVYGPPDLIRLETTRELRQSVEERNATDKRQREREKVRERARAKLREMGKAYAGRDGEENVLRLLLFEEQGGRSPYSGQQLGCADALDPTATQIDHIFPVSRSFDDSQANKVICFLRENRDKGNRTPCEYLSADDNRWSHLTEHVWPQMRTAGWPETKLRRCLRPVLEQAGDDGFTARQLVATSFIARAARDYLGLLFGGGQAGLNGVQPVPGRATALLRRAWGIGLGRLLHEGGDDGPKARDDHRHHAVDALTVALTGPQVVHSLSRWWATRETTGIRPSFGSPWPGFRDDARSKVAAIIVSHRVQAKLTGALHDAQPLGLIRDPYRDQELTFVIRKKVQAGVGGLSNSEVDRVIDKAVRERIEAAIAAAGGDLKKALSTEVRLSGIRGKPGPVIRRVRVRGMKQDPEVYDRVHREPARKQFKANQALRHIAIVRDGDSITCDPALKRECMARARGGRDITLPYRTSGKVLFSLCRGDALARLRPDGSEEVAIVTDFYRSGQIFFAPHCYSGPPVRSGSKMPGPLLNDGWRKVSVDPIGRVRPAR